MLPLQVAIKTRKSKKKRRYFITNLNFKIRYVHIKASEQVVLFMNKKQNPFTKKHKYLIYMHLIK